MIGEARFDRASDCTRGTWSEPGFTHEAAEHVITDPQRVYTCLARLVVASCGQSSVQTRSAPDVPNDAKAMQGLSATESPGRQLLRALRPAAGPARLALVGAWVEAPLERGGYLAFSDVRAAGLAVPALQMSARLARAKSSCTSITSRPDEFLLISHMHMLIVCDKTPGRRPDGVRARLVTCPTREA